MSLNKLATFDKLLAKREEATGTKGGVFEYEINGTMFEIVAAELTSDEWTEQFTNLLNDFKEDALTYSEWAEEYVNMFLGDQADEFRTAVQEVAGDVSPLKALEWILEERAAVLEKNPTRRSTHRGRKK